MWAWIYDPAQRKVIYFRCFECLMLRDVGDLAGFDFL